MVYSPVVVIGQLQCLLAGHFGQLQSNNSRAFCPPSLLGVHTHATFPPNYCSARWDELQICWAATVVGHASLGMCHIMHILTPWKASDLSLAHRPYRRRHRMLRLSHDVLPTRKIITRGVPMHFFSFGCVCFC